MAGDLEDFLRRAAQRRQTQTPAATPKPAAPPRQRPEYTDRNAERVTRASVEREEEPLTAIVVEQAEDPYAMQRRRIEAAKVVADQAEAEAAERLAKIQASSKSGSPASSYDASNNPAADLMHMLRQPGGVRQAILLREILERPEHRW